MPHIMLLAQELKSSHTHTHTHTHTSQLTTHGGEQKLGSEILTEVTLVRLCCFFSLPERVIEIWSDILSQHSGI